MPNIFMLQVNVSYMTAIKYMLIYMLTAMLNNIFLKTRMFLGDVRYFLMLIIKLKTETFHHPQFLVTLKFRLK